MQGRKLAHSKPCVSVELILLHSTPIVSMNAHPFLQGTHEHRNYLREESASWDADLNKLNDPLSLFFGFTHTQLFAPVTAEYGEREISVLDGQ